MDETDPRAEIIQRHKQEKKELQNQITKLKHSISKGDKKGKKAIQEQTTQMEKDLKEKHDKELKEFDGNENSQTDSDQISGVVEDLSLENLKGSEELSPPEPKRVSKAQKRRNKKTEMARQRQEEISRQEIENETGARNVEYQRLKDLLKEQGLQISEIPSDGDCLYNAVAHQVNKGGHQTNCKQLRQQAASYMREHAADFLPFLTTESGELFTESDFDKYCSELETTTMWGGHLEIKALSHVLNQPITVLQSDTPPVILGDDCQGDPVTLVYQRHAFGLGEHYNSVEPLQESTDT
ncbi:deubiquitinase OTUD6B-like isoform X2 [Saccostrea echinata]|uniref:deubiquitinase OTUD6B-like isoform X2 n=1 Tax=Saccostrea echinata TaxID=191078 RepID=UPI002A807E19|nr:deubiquitinase OTUD6B-like isoform X2 [Saccostrea echinata]